MLKRGRYRGSKSAIMRWSFFKTLKLIQRLINEITYPLSKARHSIAGARSRGAFCASAQKKAFLSYCYCQLQRQKKHAKACHRTPQQNVACQHQRRKKAASVFTIAHWSVPPCMPPHSIAYFGAPSRPKQGGWVISWIWAMANYRVLKNDHLNYSHSQSL